MSTHEIKYYAATARRQAFPTLKRIFHNYETILISKGIFTIFFLLNYFFYRIIFICT